MEIFNLLLVWLNVVLLLFISSKLRKIVVLEKKFKQIQNNISLLVKENSQIANVVLEDLEVKIKEAHAVMDMMKGTKEVKEQHAPLSGSKIIYLRQQGLSVQEIAEQLRIPHGEIRLKLNLYERLNKSRASVGNS